ncbi:DUF4350 domain-containing protein [Nocardioides sp.]|uniref:DUF4350 domain-containing protein n=1 Tax=Nocardioides sp. TaxID=35761 RepID=UPI003511659C
MSTTEAAKAGDTGPTAHGAARRSRRTTLLLLAALALGITAAVLARGGQQYDAALDPENPGRDGARALARVLADQGVEVDVVRSAAALERTDVAGATVVVTSGDQLAPSTLRRLQRHVDGEAPLVLVDPAFAVVLDIDDSVSTRTLTSVERRGEADCTAPVDLRDLRLAADQVTALSGGPELTTCFDGEGGAVLARLTRGDVTLFGGGQALSNDQVLRADNAAIALRLLGGRDRLVWYVPDIADATANEAVTLRSLLPRAVIPSLWLVGLAAVALLLWRVRRLGPLVTEPLPVVVRAVETTRSRGRLYRRGNDRAHAAALLREDARREVAARLRLDPRGGAHDLSTAVAAHLGVREDDVRSLLDPAAPAPATDADLVALARQLARLREEVRRA